jgi:uncharacterized membrane protein YciS (DUF1049 family)
MDPMQRLDFLRDVLYAVVVIFGFATAVLTLALVDVGLTLLLVRWSHKVKRLTELPQPESLLPELPADQGTVTILGGGIRKWE